MTSHSGKILRKAYERKAHHRKAFTRTDGVRVKATSVKKTRVPRSWVKDMGAKGKTPKSKKFLKKPLKKHAMLGYSTKSTLTGRHKRLKALVKKKSYKTAVLELNARRNLMHESAPAVAKKMSADLKWLHAHRVALKKTEGPKRYPHRKRK
jgi:Family of unknown function (DUF5771)